MLRQTSFIQFVLLRRGANMVKWRTLGPLYHPCTHAFIFCDMWGGGEGPIRPLEDNNDLDVDDNKLVGIGFGVWVPKKVKSKKFLKGIGMHPSPMRKKPQPHQMRT